MANQKEKYRTFCRDNPGLPVCFQDWYLDAVCDQGDWSALTASKNGEIQAVFPYFLKQKFGFRYITMPSFVKYSGPWWKDPELDLSTQHSLLKQFIEQLPQLHGFKQTFHYSQKNWLPFYWNGYEQRTQYTYLLDLHDLDTVFLGVNRNMRRNILKAQKQVKLDLSDDPEQFYPLNALSFKRKNLSLPYSRSQFLRHDESLARKGQRQMFFARDAQGRVHSAAYLIWDRDTAYYHLSGDDPMLRQSGAGILLIWEAIRFTKEVLGIKRFDFEGSMLPEVEAIRRQFGARQCPYFYVWKYHSPLYQVLSRF